VTEETAAAMVKTTAMMAETAVATVKMTAMMAETAVATVKMMAMMAETTAEADFTDGKDDGGNDRGSGGKDGKDSRSGHQEKAVAVVETAAETETEVDVRKWRRQW
jgi:hypothetical protein